MDTRKLIGVILGQDAERTIDLAIQSLNGCDEIIYLDGGSTDKTLDIAKHYNVTLLHNRWDDTKHGMAGEQKNFLLDYLKQKHKNSWVIWIDSDEMLDDGGVKKLRKFLEEKDENTECYNVRMRHFIYNLSLEDGLTDVHEAPTRFFKITDKIYFPTGEHISLQGMKFDNVGLVVDTVIWHLAYCGGIWDVLRRYKGQMARVGAPGGHPREFLNQWRNAHLFGQYPVKQVNPVELPSLLLEKFDIDKDSIYFANRGIEKKHPYMVKQWYDYFEPDSVLCLGCGKGPYLYFWEWLVKKVSGIEQSSWAVQNGLSNNIVHGKIEEERYYSYFDLITAIDVLEHLDDDQLDKTLKNMCKFGKRFLFSIPFIGDPNLHADKTHRQFRTKDEWKEVIESYGIKVIDAPEEWLFSQQMLIGEKIYEK